MVVLYLVFWETFILFSIVVLPIYVATNSVGGFPFLHTLSSDGLLLYLNSLTTCLVFFSLDWQRVRVSLIANPQNPHWQDSPFLHSTLRADPHLGSADRCDVDTLPYLDLFPFLLYFNCKLDPGQFGGVAAYPTRVTAMQQQNWHQQMGSRLHLESTWILAFSGGENNNICIIHEAVWHTHYVTKPCPKVHPCKVPSHLLQDGLSLGLTQMPLSSKENVFRYWLQSFLKEETGWDSGEYLGVWAGYLPSASLESSSSLSAPFSSVS